MSDEQRNGEELSWTLVFVSSQDDLTIEASKMYSRDFIYGKGWISEQYARYPQELIVRLEDISTIQQISILSHHLYIPQYVDIFVGMPRNQSNANPHWTDAHFIGMGTANFQNNIGHDGGAAERKTIYTSAVGLFLKFVFAKNHDTPSNKMGQVAIYGVKILGVEQNKNDPQFVDGYDSDTYVADAILSRREKKKNKKKDKNVEKEVAKPKVVDKAFAVDHEEYDELWSLLEAKKQEQAAKRNFDDANNLKVVQDDLKKQKTAILQLHDRIMAAVASQDYNNAKNLQRQYDRDRYYITKTYKKLPRYLNEREHHRYIDNFGERERARQQEKSDPGKLEGQVEGDIPGRHYHYNPRRYGGNESHEFWDDWSNGRPDAVTPIAGRPDTAHEKAIRTTGFPDDEARIQRILEMDKNKDKGTDEELTKVLKEMQKADRHDLDWRLQKRVDTSRAGVLKKRRPVPRATRTPGNVYDYKPATPRPKTTSSTIDDEDIFVNNVSRDNSEYTRPKVLLRNQTGLSACQRPMTRGEEVPKYTKTKDKNDVVTPRYREPGQKVKEPKPEKPREPSPPPRDPSPPPPRDTTPPSPPPPVRQRTPSPPPRKPEPKPKKEPEPEPELSDPESEEWDDQRCVIT